MLKTVLLTKLKVATAVLLMLSVAGAASLLSYHALATEPAPAQRQPQERTARGRRLSTKICRKSSTSFRAARPDAKDLAIFQLDWMPTLKEAKVKAAKEQRPILMIVVENSFGNNMGTKRQVGPGSQDRLVRLKTT